VHHSEGTGPLDVLWEVAGEQGTKWFHQLDRKCHNPGPPLTAVKGRTAGGQGTVFSVHEPGGVAQVGQVLSAFFDGRNGGLFAPAVLDVAAQDLLLGALGSRVPDREAAACLGPAGDGSLTVECCRMALAGTPGGKTPGCDGLTYEVYKALWGVLGQALVDCFNEAFAEGAGGQALLTMSQRSGVITLIHKGEGKPTDEVSAYRPITLLNCDYKIVTRVLVQRMCPEQQRLSWTWGKQPSCQAGG